VRFFLASWDLVVDAIVSTSLWVITMTFTTFLCKLSIFKHIYRFQTNFWRNWTRKIINEVAVATTVGGFVALVAKSDELGVTSSLEQHVHVEPKIS
jgi:hypothetical protein